MLQTRPRNRLLAALPEAEWDLLRPCLTRVDLKPRQVLQHGLRLGDAGGDYLRLPPVT